MKFTFIIPVYNSQETISACIESLLNQEGFKYGNDYEIIVVDDGSTDHTSEIINSFPVRHLKHIENRGRISARLTGANVAKTQKLIFLDSRNTASSNLLRNVSMLSFTPAISADLAVRENKYKSIFNTIMFLIRRTYYGKRYFEKSLKDSYITKANFLKSPKGTTLLVIDRDLFLKINPKQTSKTTSDDTLLFHNLVYKENIEILRSTKLKINYLQRTKLSDLAPWLFHRGRLFGDYYLKKGGPYYKYVLPVVFITIISLALCLVFPTFAIILLVLFCFVCIALSENIRDFFILLIGLPLVVMIFSSGLIRYFIDELLLNEKKD